MFSPRTCSSNPRLAEAVPKPFGSAARSEASAVPDGRRVTGLRRRVTAR